MTKRFRVPPMAVFNREDAEAYVPTDMTTFAISITDPPTAPANLHPNFAFVHRLSFCDVFNGFETPPEYPTITRDDAVATMAFVERIRESATLLVIHCEAGVSRSPSTAAAIDYVYGRRPHEWDMVNFAVISRLIRAARHLNLGVYSEPYRMRRNARNGFALRKANGQ